MTEYLRPQKDHAALITLSIQRDYILPSSPIRASGLSRVIPTMTRLVQGVRERDVPLYHSIRLYKPDGSNVDLCRRSAVEEGLRIFMPGSLGAELVDEIQPEGEEVRINPDILFDGKFQEIGPDESIFYRPRWGAFHGTSLEQELRSRGVDSLILCGFSFNTATRATIYEASARDFKVVVVPDALCNASEQGLEELGRMGVYLMEADEVLSWLGTPKQNGKEDRAA
ncbi:cysteine hydrolase [Kiloniella laminariae]|uniref:Cysteine hydrolase n=1 Tax=Kiloniella laminariae TaxID=454162 RepID=A0ABT4LPG1_9PROT|nr:isochorismatase family cysteine hydrolase [Kiloniella laminariae]MCZ4282986.1 cysteine hydrolase [Kiloniella laminariae]